MKKQKNNHARSKKNKAKIKAKMRHLKLMQKHLGFSSAMTPAQIRTLFTPTHVPSANGQIKKRYNTKIVGHKNQRQQRKIWRNAPHMRKRA